MDNNTMKVSSEKAPRLGAAARSGLATVFLGLTVLSLLPGVAVGHPSADGTQRKVRKASPAKAVEPEPVVTPVQEAPPPPPLTPGQMPPNPPRVTYEDGMLSIAAENSTLADILSAVKAATGTPMDIPVGAGADRVWVTLGPGPARPILAALLTGTSLDYVIQASDTDPNLMQSVQLSPRKGGKVGDTGGGSSSSQSFASRFRQSLNHSNVGAADGSDAESSGSPDAPVGAPESDTASAAAATPTATADAQAAAVDPSSTGTGMPSAALSAHLPLNISEADAHPSPVANPDQAIPQMQNLFELRRQLQAQQNAQQKSAGSR